MNVSHECIDIIARFEGFRSKPYLCPAGVPTIGFGSTRYEGGRKVSMSDPEISRERAFELMANTLNSEFVPGVFAAAHRDLKQNQLDALVSIAYNIGVSALAGSTLMKKFNSGDAEGAAKEFLRWNKAGGVVLAGLTKRREAESALFYR